MDFGEHPFTLENPGSLLRDGGWAGLRGRSGQRPSHVAVPWLDGPTALSAVLVHSGEMSLVTTLALPVVRGPVPLVKSLAAIDRLSDGRLVVGVGPGSSERDYAAVGIDFDERWARIDEAVQTMRILWRRDESNFTGRFYSTDGVSLEPGPTSVDGPPVWIGSWGSPAGLRRVARLGEGWLASGCDTTPALFAEAWASLEDLLIREGKDPLVFRNALATMWC